MKTLQKLIPLIVILVLHSCGSSKDNTLSYETFWVNSYKSQCNAGVGETKCLNIYKGNNPENATWQHFYSEIEGFNFEEGTLQKIRVKVERLDKESVPADASNLKYTLLEIKEKQKDSRIMLQGEWLLTTLNNKSIDANLKKPTLHIDLIKNRIYGNNSCNDYTGSIEKITTNTMALGNIASTRKMCNNMTIETEFTFAANSIKSYKLNNHNLTLYNEKGETVLSFKKKENNMADHRINDIWVAKKINGKPITQTKNYPRLEVNLTNMRLMGNDGCNTYFADIKSISEKNIQIGGIATTQKACVNLDTAIRYGEALNNSATYKVEEGTLTFFDKNNAETLFLQKTD